MGDFLSAVPGVLGAVGVIVGVIVGLGGLAVYLGRSKDTGTIASLERQNLAFKSELEQVSGQLADAQRHIGNLESRVNVLETENSALRETRPSAEVLAELAVALGEHRNEVLAAHEAMLAGNQAILAVLEDIRGSFNAT